MTTIVLDRLPPPSTEGASSRLNCMIEHIAAVDPACRVICAFNGPPPRSRAMLLLASLPRLLWTLARVFGSSNRILLLSSPALPFFRTESRIDVLLASIFLRLTRLLQHLTGKLVLLNLHDLRSIQIPAFGIEVAPGVLEMYRKLESIALNSCDYVLTHGGAWPELLMREYGMRAEQIIDFPNGNTRLSPPPAPQIASRPGLKLVYAGTMSQAGRELDAFIERFAAVKRDDVTLYLVGPGSDGEPGDTAGGGDLRVHRLGALPLAECIAAVSACDLAVYPYPDSDYFNMMHTTNKMALYVTCRLPVLARASRYVSAFIERHDIGLALTLDEMPAAIARLAGDPETLRNWQQNTEAIAEDYYWDTIIDRAFSTALERWGSDQRWPGAGRPGAPG